MRKAQATTVFGTPSYLAAENKLLNNSTVDLIFENLPFVLFPAAHKYELALKRNHVKHKFEIKPKSRFCKCFVKWENRTTKYAGTVSGIKVPNAELYYICQRDRRGIEIRGGERKKGEKEEWRTEGLREQEAERK